MFIVNFRTLHALSSMFYALILVKGRCSYWGGVIHLHSHIQHCVYSMYKCGFLPMCSSVLYSVLSSALPFGLWFWIAAICIQV